jgi:hypothetical protein
MIRGARSSPKPPVVSSGERRSMPQPTDQELVAAVLGATANLSLRERQRATGLSHFTFARFQNGYAARGGWTYLQGRTRATVIRYLERVGKMPREAAGSLTDADRARLLELWEEMGRILKRVG